MTISYSINRGDIGLSSYISTCQGDYKRSSWRRYIHLTCQSDPSGQKKITERGDLMLDGYYALLKTICLELGIDEAVEIECGPDARPKKRGRKTKLDLPLREIVSQKQNGLSWADLGEIYGVNSKSLQSHVNRCRRAVRI